MLIGFLSGFGLLGLVIWLRLLYRRKARAEQILSIKIDQLLTALPRECQTWGGRAALADRETVQAILREVDTH
jgi:hypothetical protein